jgi:hypothetical protein|tara:strand:- start:624 stop:863 length:240 start_codon:yes stop_codon:yes gene_type:complete
MELFGFLIIIVVIIFIIWFLPKAVKGWKVSWVGVIIAFILAFMTKGDGTPLWLFILVVIYYLIAVVIFKAIKEIRGFKK